MKSLAIAPVFSQATLFLARLSLTRLSLATLTLTTVASACLPLSANAATPNPTQPASTKISWVTPKQPTLRLLLTPNFTASGERILSLELIVDGKIINQFQAVSGKADVQHFRTGKASRAKSREPLPQGTYEVGYVDRRGGLPAAMGDMFIPLTPLFATGRDGIGIHWDADRGVKGGPGTIGCLGVLERANLEEIARFISTYNVKTLIVDYGLPPS